MFLSRFLLCSCQVPCRFLAGSTLGLAGLAAWLLFLLADTHLEVAENGGSPGENSAPVNSRFIA